MEEVVEEETPTVQTGPSTLSLTPELLGPFSNIDFRAIFFLVPSPLHKGRLVAGGRKHRSWSEACWAVIGVV